MRDERRPADDDDEEEEVFPAGERAPAEIDRASGEETFPAGAESDEGQRPGEKLEERQPGLAEDPPRAD